MTESIRRGHLVPDQPTVSVIVPNYNTARYIAETLDSVFAQTFTDLEVIVVNDASPDTSEFHTVVAPYLDRVTLVENDKNLGTSATRNLAANIARGTFLCFLDADDIWEREFLEELLKFRDGSDYDVAYADCKTFSSDGSSSDFRALNPEQGDITRTQVIEGKCHILPSGAVIRREAFLAIGGFDAAVTRTEDFDLWMRMLFAGARFGYLRKLLFRFRISPGSGSGDAVVRIERCVLAWRTLLKKLDFTEAEKSLIAYHIKNYEIAAIRAKGRDAIYRRDWPAARSSFRTALNAAPELQLPSLHQMKLRGVLILLTLAPSLLRWAYRKMRPSETEYLPSSLSE